MTMQQEFINDGYPVKQWQGVNPNRLKRAIELSTPSQQICLMKVFNAFMDEKPIRKMDFEKAKTQLFNVEGKMLERFMEEPAHNKYQDNSYDNRNNGGLLWAFFAGLIALFSILEVKGRE